MRLLLAGVVVAATGGAGPVEDPAVVIGVQLGRPLAAQSTPACPPGARHSRLPTPCLDRAVPLRGEEALVPIWNPPPLAFDYSADVIAWRGVAAAVTMTVPARQFDRAVASLTERFGRPSAEEAHQVTTLGGAVLQSRVITWTAGPLMARATERADRADEAVVTVEHRETAAAMRAAREAGGSGRRM